MIHHAMRITAPCISPHFYISLQNKRAHREKKKEGGYSSERHGTPGESNETKDKSMWETNNFSSTFLDRNRQ
jgi:hypothetical protein